jgi:hypothetical protein
MELIAVSSIDALVGWDQRVNMPPPASPYVAYLTRKYSRIYKLRVDDNKP